MHLTPGTTAPAASEQSARDTAAADEPETAFREPDAQSEGLLPASPVQAAATGGGARATHRGTFSDGVTAISAALAGTNIRDPRADSPGGSRRVTASADAEGRIGTAVAVAGPSTDAGAPQPQYK